MRHVAHINESYHTYQWGMSHIWMSHMSHTWIGMSHIWMSHATHMNEVSSVSDIWTHATLDSFIWVHMSRWTHWHSYLFICPTLSMTYYDMNSYEWVQYDIWTHMNESNVAHMNGHVAHVDESRRRQRAAYEWVMSYIWRRVTHMKESCRTYEWACRTRGWVTSQTKCSLWMSHVIRMTSCHKYGGVVSHIWISMSHTWMSHVAVTETTRSQERTNEMRDSDQHTAAVVIIDQRKSQRLFVRELRLQRQTKCSQARTNELCGKQKKVLGYLTASHSGKKERTNERKKVIHDLVDNVQSMNESCHTYKYVTSHI